MDWFIGRKLMWVVVTAEWMNHLLKWLLHGERPYWWVHEADVYNGKGIPVPNIYQFSLTCETGPGSPSGHSQITAAVWYVIFDSFLEKYHAIVEKDGHIRKLCWLAYFFLLATIGASRIFIAAHFPHQCLFGMFLATRFAVTASKLGISMTFSFPTLPPYSSVIHCLTLTNLQPHSLRALVQNPYFDFVVDMWTETWQWNFKKVTGL
ncbi:glucose-6-phosphatase [Trichonephila inaurata madagascariensis]|uniref:glucose-6-phosphatase n=1 Tax=Trichonephila inaurata madagascariensis TaxID=2747483 RepID=A0A8X6YVR7_9ARAC|nr:glucose-6-phosphatase [Trichonephila inaurata madagascariensis]